MKKFKAKCRTPEGDEKEVYVTEQELRHAVIGDTGYNYILEHRKVDNEIVEVFYPNRKPLLKILQRDTIYYDPYNQPIILKKGTTIVYNTRGSIVEYIEPDNPHEIVIWNISTNKRFWQLKLLFFAMLIYSFISVVMAKTSHAYNTQVTVEGINVIIKNTASKCEQTFKLGDFVITECPVNVNEQVYGKVRTITGGGNVLYFIKLRNYNDYEYEAIVKETDTDYIICKKDSIQTYEALGDYANLEYNPVHIPPFECEKVDKKTNKKKPLEAGDNLFFKKEEQKQPEVKKDEKSK